MSAAPAPYRHPLPKCSRCGRPSQRTADHGPSFPECADCAHGGGWRRTEEARTRWARSRPARLADIAYLVAENRE